MNRREVDLVKDNMGKAEVLNNVCQAFKGPEGNWNSHQRLTKSSLCACPDWLTFLMKFLTAWIRGEEWLLSTKQFHSTGAALSRNASLLRENTADSKVIPDPCHNSQ